MAQEPSSNYAVAIVAETPDGIPMVSDPKKPEPRFWKFPGGRNQLDETPVKAAIREMREETGVSVSADEMRLIHRETRGASGGSHGFFVFHARITRKVELLERGAGGEIVKFFTGEELKTLPNFFPSHRNLARKFIF